MGSYSSCRNDALTMSNGIVVIDYGVGNVHSVCSALSFLGYRNIVSRDPNIISDAAAFVLPGVGAFGEAMAKLDMYALTERLTEEVIVKCKPLLGICLGMQVIGNSSEESVGCRGLSWIDFKVIKMRATNTIKIPHVGWNTICIDRDPYFFRNMEENPHFYFDHSYYVNSGNDIKVATCTYGDDFPAVISRNNIIGVQFHPEKSQGNGLKLFRNIFKYFGIKTC